MHDAGAHVRHGIGAVRPYVCGPSSLPEFLKDVFDARELERHVFGPDSFHVELQIGDSVVVVEAGELPSDVSPWLNAIYVYVPDVDAVVRKAVELGAAIISPAQDERQAGFRDAAGNTWWVSTFDAGSSAA